MDHPDGSGPDRGSARLAVRVPEPLRDLFARAQDYVERYFADRVDDPQGGVIEISGERYILVRAASLSTEFFELVSGVYRDRGEAEARRVADSFLFDVAHALGRADARAFHKRMGLSDPMSKLSAGPVHFAFAGWALVEIHPESHPAPDDSFVLVYDHPASFEADSWLRSGKTSDAPVCTMSAGYSSGWCEESFGLPLVAVEVECRAARGERCRFIMAPPERIRERLDSQAPVAAARNAAVPEFFERKRLEDERRIEHDLLERMVADRTAELTLANERLRDEMEQRRRAEGQLSQLAKMEAIGQLAGGLAHDFNNLLTTILAGVQMALRRTGSDQSSAEWLRHALAATERAADLTRHMLTLSRRQVPEMAAVDVGSMLRSTASFLESSIPRNVKVSVRVAPPEAVAWGDRTQLEHALINLAINGRDAMPEGGELAFDADIVRIDEAAAAAAPAARAGEFVRIAVSDTGIGMPADVVERIFEPLFTTKMRGGGTGFGLPRVYACALSHGGWVTVASELGKGSRFELYVPRAKEGVSVGVHRAVELPTGDETVLLVDDTEAVLYAGKSILESCGYYVLVARDGTEALDVLQREPGVALVISDLVMPGLDGRALLAALRERGATVPVVLTSGHAVDRSAEEIAEEGFAGFVPKPFDIERLAAAVRAAIDAAG